MAKTANDDEVAAGGDDPSGTEATVRRLVDLLSSDELGLTDGELAEALIAIDSLGSRIAARRSSLVSRWDASMIWAGDGARSAGAWLTARCEVTRGQASWEVHQARMLRAMPHVAAAFAEGRLGSAKVRSLVKAREGVEEAFAAHEQWLVEQAEALTVVHAGYLLRRWRLTALADASQDDAAAADAKAGLHLSQTFDGEWALDGTCDPESGAILKRAIEDEVDALFRRGDATIDDGLTPARRRMAALVEIVRRGSHTASAEPDGAAGAAGETDSAARDSAAHEGDASGGGATQAAERGAPDSAAGETDGPVSSSAGTAHAHAATTAAAGRPTVILQIDAHTADREPVRTSRDLEFRANDLDGTEAAPLPHRHPQLRPSITGVRRLHVQHARRPTRQCALPRPDGFVEPLPVQRLPSARRRARTTWALAAPQARPGSCSAGPRSAKEAGARP
jgi:hypothetical protein